MLQKRQGSLPYMPVTMLATIFQTSEKLEPIIDHVKTPEIIFPHDAIVRVCKTTICGTDLHLLRGAVNDIPKHTIMGHEGIGEVVRVGSAVSKFKIGDRIIVPCITRCGKCAQCAKQFYGHCEDGGWLLGHTIDGMQAEYARVPHVDASCYFVPESVRNTPNEDKYVMLSDILPTALEIGLLDGKVGEGMTIGIVGVGPVGLAAVLTATSFFYFKPLRVVVVDIDEHRLATAKSMGATDAINNKKGDAVEQIMQLTNGKGLDLMVEAIGVPAGWEICQNAVKSGGHIAILGVHGTSAVLNLEKMWYRNFSMTAGMVHGYSIDNLLERVNNSSLDAGKLISHYFKMSDMASAYNTFASASSSKCLKVIITNDNAPTGVHARL